MRQQIEQDLKQLARDKEEQEKIKEGLLELYALKEISKDEYATGIERVKSKLARIALDESNNKKSLLPLSNILDRAVIALEHLDVLWKMASEKDKRALAKTLFPDGFTCTQEGGVGTPSTAHQFGRLPLLDNPDSPWALPRGIEPRFPA